MPTIHGATGSRGIQFLSHGFGFPLPGSNFAGSFGVLAQVFQCFLTLSIVALASSMFKSCCG